MKNILLVTCVMLLAGSSIFGQSGTWTWMNGGNTIAAAAGNYGVQGVAAATNLPPGRYQAAYWKDLNGNFWLFGGYSNQTFVSEMADMWKYNPTTNLWTWMSGSNIAGSSGVYGTQGIPSVNNYPPARGWGANCWTDSAGNFWLFGGYGAGNTFNDLWKYNPATNEWTWVSGTNTSTQVSPAWGTQGIATATNNPGSRQECKSGWVDGHNLIMFGGASSDVYNDVWRFSIATNLWTWIGGTNNPNDAGSYGTLGVTIPTNAPPSRFSYTKWKKGKKIYLFAGTQANIVHTFNDMWEYDLNTNLFTWVGGTNTFAIRVHMALYAALLPTFCLLHVWKIKLYKLMTV